MERSRASSGMPDSSRHCCASRLPFPPEAPGGLRRLIAHGSRQQCVSTPKRFTPSVNPAQRHRWAVFCTLVTLFLRQNLPVHFTTIRLNSPLQRRSVCKSSLVRRVCYGRDSSLPIKYKGLPLRLGCMQGNPSSGAPCSRSCWRLPTTSWMPCILGCRTCRRRSPTGGALSESLHPSLEDADMSVMNLLLPSAAFTSLDIQHACRSRRDVFAGPAILLSMYQGGHDIRQRCKRLTALAVVACRAGLMLGAKPLQASGSAEGVVLNDRTARTVVQSLAAVLDCIERLMSQSASLPVPVPSTGVLMFCSRLLSVDDSITATGAPCEATIMLSQNTVSP